MQYGSPLTVDGFPPYTNVGIQAQIVDLSAERSPRNLFIQPVRGK